MTTKPLSLEDIFLLARNAMLNAGANEENADAIADTVMQAERDGSHSHGLFRVPGYVASLVSGKVNGNANPKIQSRTPVALHCDGDHGYAPVAHRRSLHVLADAAVDNGISVLSIDRIHHFAALWPEVETLAKRGLVAIACVSYTPNVAPFGAKQPLYGTNPLSFAWPRPDAPPLVFDMATAAMAMGDIQIAARDGRSVPIGTGLDARGHATTDPSEIIKGVLLPFGGYKGSHIAMMVELLAGPLVGETVSFVSKERDNGDGGPPQGGQFVIAMNPEILSGGNWIEQSEGFISRLSKMDGVRLPAERRYLNRKNTGPRQVNSDLLEQLQSKLK
ncbi:MAG: oxidoreductase [Acidiferrobacteraceae bacterium]|nr:oxidoreductase [Acidiferrobacteraceae bacterium]